ncbi:peptidoglycan-recognition protein LB isoform X2 [Toxorhynchites rutilus septentrionalis]|uniref:peptidoglycan-recognition protein LB isoform X2 n=1 Tax=Toxorhynchites rutilus septentrionalis TaxID=329112 RepID=UPI0024790E9B|nr:peptidoglycan-recognition protein LB isoform X2 [Toxorhynchites rutilus septentrionalis]
MMNPTGLRNTIALAVLHIIIPLNGAWSCLPYVTREAWDAMPPRSVEKFPGPIPYVIIHHSYEPAACFDYQECRKAMQSMQRFHQLDRGWNDIGYSFAVGGDGRVYQGRGFNVVGAHAPRYNDKSVGICMIGDWRFDLPPKNMLLAVQSFIDYGVRHNIIAANYTLIGHRQVRPTECPGDRLYKEIQTWPHYSPMLDVVDPNSIRT